MFVGMQTSSNTLLVGLLVLVVILASSTVYMAFIAYQPNPRASAQNVTSSSSTNSITATGVGQVSYTPNEALIQVSIENQNSSAVVATSSNAATVVSVIKALNGIGISNSSIQTQGYNLSPDYSNCYSGLCVPQITGYTVTNSIQVNVTSSDPTRLGLNAGNVIDTAVGAGANSVSLSFAASQSVMNQLTGQALQDAISSASSQAHVIADSLGVSITGVISSTQSSSGYPQPLYGMTYASSTTNVSTPIVPGTQTLSESVVVVYSIS